MTVTITDTVATSVRSTPTPLADPCASLIGASPRFRRAVALAQRVAGTDAAVLLTGESGSGKELFAHHIHAHSRRTTHRFVPVNCAALPEALLESEVFGHCRGAFTGAIRDKAGLLEAAHGGTLFLDEVVEMSRHVQAKLLRVLQDGVVRRLGSEATDAVVDLRLIAATNRDPEVAVSEGLLREDFYFRLRVVPIVVPPLRERPEDIPLLARHFLTIYWAQHRGTDVPAPHLGIDALWALVTYAWPGNVRELQNLIEHTVVLVEPAAQIRPQDLPLPGHGAATSNGSRAPCESYYTARDRLLDEFGRDYLTRAVRLTGGNLSQAARLAGLDRTSLYRLLKRHGVRGA